MMLEFFDYWLKGIDRGYTDQPPVRLFVMGDDAWRDEDEWPLARAIATTYFLRSGGAANSFAGDGTLSRQSPPAGEASDSYEHDPRDPVPTRGGNLCC